MRIAEQELPLNSARDAVRFHVTITCAAIVADRHGGEEQEHGHAPMDGSDGGAVQTPLEL